MKEIFLKVNSLDIAINHYESGHDECIVIAPGWFMTKDSESFSEIAQMFSPDFDVITMDFRGHGRSGGFYTFTCKESSDIESVVNYAQKKYKKVYLMGFSLGAAMAVIDGAKDPRISKIIAVSPPCCFNKIENHYWKKEAWGPTFKKFELKRWISIRPSIKGLLCTKKPSPIEVVANIKVPILFIAGEKDPTVYCWHTEKLYAQANEPKKLIIIKDGIHAEDLFLKDKEYFINTCKNWLKQ